MGMMSAPRIALLELIWGQFANPAYRGDGCRVRSLMKSQERVSVPRDFQPRRWLRGGHVQTVASFLLPRRVQLPPAEERLIEVEPGIAVRCWCHWQRERQSAMTLIVVHGLEGSTESQYMLGVARNGLSAGMYCDS